MHVHVGLQPVGVASRDSMRRRRFLASHTALIVGLLSLGSCPPAALAQPTPCAANGGVQQVYANGERAGGWSADGRWSGGVCCAGTCGTCGGVGCADLPGGYLQCCTARIAERGVQCADNGYATVSTVGCLDGASAPPAPPGPPPADYPTQTDWPAPPGPPPPPLPEDSVGPVVAVVIIVEVGIVAMVAAILVGINRCIKTKKQALGPGTRVSDSAWIACLVLCMCNLACFMWIPFVVSPPTCPPCVLP